MGKAEKIVKLTTPANSTNATNGTANATTDTCGGVGISNGIAQAIAQGDLDFGGKVSEMSYQCSEVISNETQFNITKIEVEKANSPSKGKIDIVYKPLNSSNLTSSVSSSDSKDAQKMAMYGAAIGLAIATIAIVVYCIMKGEHAMPIINPGEQPPMSSKRSQVSPEKKILSREATPLKQKKKVPVKEMIDKPDPLSIDE